MRPSYLAGDLVEFDHDRGRRCGIVVSVQQSSQVPDAHFRGIANVFPWSYYVFDGEKIVGPMTGGWMKHVN